MYKNLIVNLLSLAYRTGVLPVQLSRLQLIASYLVPDRTTYISTSSTKMHMLTPLVSLCLPALISASPPHHHPAEPEPPAPPLTFLYTSYVHCLNNIYESQGPRGIRTTIPIIGGNFTGPRLSGTIPSDPSSSFDADSLSQAKSSTSEPIGESLTLKRASSWQTQGITSRLTMARTSSCRLRDRRSRMAICSFGRCLRRETRTITG